MVDDLGAVFGEYLLHPVFVLDVGDDEFQMVGILFVGLVVAKLELEVVHGRFGLVEKYDFAGFVLDELAADFAANRTGGTGDHHRFVDDFADDVDVVEFDALAFQEVFNLDVLYLVDGERVVNPFADVGHGLDGQSKVECLGGDCLFAFYLDSGYGNEQGLYLVFGDEGGVEDGLAMHDVDAVEGGVAFFAVVVDVGNNFVVVCRVLTESVVSNHSSSTGTVDDDVCGDALAAYIIVVDAL